MGIQVTVQHEDRLYLPEHVNIKMFMEWLERAWGAKMTQYPEIPEPYINYKDVAGRFYITWDDAYILYDCDYKIPGAFYFIDILNDEILKEQVILKWL